LFLDEVAELPLAMQTKLLRVLEDLEVRPVGADTRRKVDVRVVAAANRSLETMVAAGAFREDLYYRLKVFEIRVPNLATRRADIPALALNLIERHARVMGRSVPHATPAVLERLKDGPWPGNVRQLENVIERALILCEDELKESHFDMVPLSILPPAGGGSAPEQGAAPFREAKSKFERSYLRALLDSAGGSRTEAARIAHLDPSNLRRMLRKHGIS
jgi:DNA-binding NtrC family response regulator